MGLRGRRNEGDVSVSISDYGILVISLSCGGGEGGMNEVSPG